MTAAVVSPAALFVDALVLSEGLWSSRFAFVAGAAGCNRDWKPVLGYNKVYIKQYKYT